MQWKKLSEYAMKSGPWIVGKFYTPAGIRYGLSHDDGRPVIYFNTFDQAKEYVNENTTRQIT